MSIRRKRVSSLNPPRKFDIPEALSLIHACDTGYRITPNQTNFRDSYWLWDSGFLAMGLASLSPSRAKEELRKLMESQHPNGMIPHVVVRSDLPLSQVKHFISWGNQQHNDLQTSGITQPPVIATATRVVAEHLSNFEERQCFLRDIYESLVKYHEWFLRERDPDKDGQVTILHPWESGMDNSPSILASFQPTRFEKTFGQLITPFRYDVREGLDAALRTPHADSLAMARLVYQLRSKKYDARQILDHNPTYAVNSVFVNSILLKATKDLAWIANQIEKELPTELQAHLKRGKDILDTFWHKGDQRFYDINAINHQHIRIPTISNIIPIIHWEMLSDIQGKRLIQMLKDTSEFAAPYLVPTVARSFRLFNDRAYWSGPMWPWINRYLFYGAQEAGEHAIASKLRDAVIDTVSKHGAYEHYSPLTGEPYGAKGFSPTAATFIELALLEPM
jgi:glycogen debranching enzyme